MAKRRGSQRYTTPTGYRYSKNKYDQLRRAIKNFNSRLQRAYNKIDERLWDLLPDRLKLSDLRDRVTSTKEVNEMISRLEMYRKEGFELTENPYGNGFITKAQLEIAEREARQENRRRKRLLAMAEQGAEAEGRLPTDQTAQLRPVNAGLYTTNSKDPLANIMFGRRIGEQTIAWQQRYMGGLYAVLDVLPSYGMSAESQSHVERLVGEIINMVNSLSPEDYYYAQLVFPVLSITIVTDIPLFIRGVEEIAETWANFYNSRRG